MNDPQYEPQVAHANTSEPQKQHQQPSGKVNIAMSSELEFIAMLANNILYVSLCDLFFELARYDKISSYGKRLLTRIKELKLENSSCSVKVYSVKALFANDVPRAERLTEIVQYYCRLNNFDEISHTAKVIQEFCNNLLFQTYALSFQRHLDLKRFQDDVSRLELKPLKILPKLNFNDISVETLKDMLTGNEVIKSFVNEINMTNDFGGYLKGTLVAVASAPGGGKSNLLMAEVYNMITEQGKKGYWLALGDLMEVDFIARFGSIHYQIPKEMFIKEIDKYYTDDFRKLIGEHLDFSIIEPGKLSVEEFKEVVNNDIDKMKDDFYDFIVVDYDANFSNLESGEHMYQAHSIIYNSLISLAKSGKKSLVFIAGQIKNEYQQEEIVPANGLAESSKKQNIIDMALTISRQKLPVMSHDQLQVSFALSGIMSKLPGATSFGIINKAKERRGDTIIIPYISTSYCYKTITISEYNELKRLTREVFQG